MAYVYADMDALAEYQQQIVQTLSTLEDQVGCKEDMIESTKVIIRAAIVRAEEAERVAYASLQVAKEQLCKAEQRTKDYNSNLAKDQKPMTTPEFYYDNLYENEQEYLFAEATRSHAENTLSNFEAYVRNYEQQQADGIERFKKLLGMSGKFFENYIKKLIAVKKSTVVSSDFFSKSTELRNNSCAVVCAIQQNEEKNELDRARAAAVKAAWAQEAARVQNGRGTRNWTVAQQAELLKYGSVSGFEGQHMKNVADYPQYAGDPNNIQFLTPQEHLYGGHDGNWKNASNGRLDLSTGQIIPFDENEPPSVPEIELTDKYDLTQFDLTENLGRLFGYGRREDSKNSRERVFGDFK